MTGNCRLDLMKKVDGHRIGEFEFECNGMRSWKLCSSKMNGDLVNVLEVMDCSEC